MEKKLTKKLTKLKEPLAVQGSDGNWNNSDYMTGMFKSMELAVAMMDDREQQYEDCLKRSGF